MTSCLVLVISILASPALSWNNLPQTPTGRRLQFFLLGGDGSYKYGYDTGDGQTAKQSGDPSNQVEGQYSYLDPVGLKHNVKYTSGVQGFLPDESLQAFVPVPSFSFIPHLVPPPEDQADDAFSLATPKAANQYPGYSFGYSTDNQARQESSDSEGNVQGSYAYRDDGGEHDLSYTANDEVGFVVTGGNLAPKTLTENLVATTTTESPSGDVGTTTDLSVDSTLVTDDQSEQSTQPIGTTTPSSDGSYSFGFLSDNQARGESADSEGNVEGRYAYRDEEGHHDLSYRAGGGSGFVVTGGNLAPPTPEYLLRPSGVQNVFRPGQIFVQWYFRNNSQPTTRIVTPDTPDPSGNTFHTYYPYNRYPNYRNGYQNPPTPNIYNGVIPKVLRTNQTTRIVTPDVPDSSNLIFAPPPPYYPNYPIYYPPNYYPPNPNPNPATQPQQPDDQFTDTVVVEAGRSLPLYDFAFKTDSYKRQESGSANGDVNGRFWYKNSAGNNDLAFVAGSETGFRPIGGSLSVPPGLTGEQLRSVLPLSGNVVAREAKHNSE